MSRVKLRPRGNVALWGRAMYHYNPTQALEELQEDGLLPTTIFKRVFISYADHFVMFEPR